MHREPQSTADRVAAALFGALFVGLAVAIVLTFSEDSVLGASIAALVVGGLGVDALISAALGRRSLASRIGPLP
jgi:hypothetical protein